MKLTNMEILNMKEPLFELSKAKLPVPTSLEVLKLIRKLDEYLIPVETLRANLIRRHGTENDSGSCSINPGDPNWSKFHEDYGELVSQEVEVDINVIKLPTTMEIAPVTVMALEKIVSF